MSSPIRTERLLLKPATLETAVAERDAPDNLWCLLDSEPASAWPPPLNDEQSLSWVIEFLGKGSGQVGWALWYFFLAEADALIPVGNGGFKGAPDSLGAVEIGYSILEEHQGRGYATEATRGLVGWAFEHPAVQKIVAHTLPDLKGSIRVLEKNGFLLVGDGEEPGTIRFEKMHPQKKGAVRDGS